jgi:hypothetical protein
MLLSRISTMTKSSDHQHLLVTLLLFVHVRTSCHVFSLSWCAETLCEEVVHLLVDDILVCVRSRAWMELLRRKSRGDKLYEYQTDLLDRRPICCHRNIRNSGSRLCPEHIWLLKFGKVVGNIMNYTEKDFILGSCKYEEYKWRQEKSVSFSISPSSFLKMKIFTLFHLLYLFIQITVLLVDELVIRTMCVVVVNKKSYKYRIHPILRGGHHTTPRVFFLFTKSWFFAIFHRFFHGCYGKT